MAKSLEVMGVSIDEAAKQLEQLTKIMNQFSVGGYSVRN